MIRSFLSLVLALSLLLTPSMSFGQFQGTAPVATFRETDQSISGGGYWRWKLNGGVITLEKNTSADGSFGTTVVPLTISGTALQLDSAASLTWNGDTVLVRDGAANTLALKNSTNAQTLRVYGTTTGPKYLQLLHDGSDSRIYSQTGALILRTVDDSVLNLDTNNAARWVIGNSAIGPYAMYPASDNVYDLGRSGVQVRSGYFGTSVVLGADAILVRDASNVLALKNSTNAQEFRVYGSTTGPKYAALGHDGSNAYIYNNTGNLVFHTTFAPVNDNSQDIGSGSKRIRTLYAGSTIELGSTPATAGIIRLPNLTFLNARNFVNSANVPLIGLDAVDSVVVGDTTTASKITSSLGTPGSLRDGDWWVSCTGTSPARTCSLNVRDTGSTRTIVTSSAF